LNEPVPRVHARRVIFIDLARAIAVVLMISGHTSSALLAPVYRQGNWVHAWEFQRGLTSALFLLLSGFAFSIATTRHWASHIRPSAAFGKRLRRFGLFVLLGYALHFPVPTFAQLATATDQQWRTFLAVDVLQLIGVTFVAVQLLVLATRSRRVFMVASFVLAVILIGLSPVVWRTDWTGVLPPSLASYLSPATGSLFPVFPWAGFVLIGAGAGQIYARWGAAHLRLFANWGMLLPGVVLTLLASSLSGSAPPPPAPDDFSWVPAQIVLRTGVCLMILGVVAHASERIGQLPHVFGAVAQESLVVYFVHLCIVYGSIWNSGLHRFYGESLGPGATVFAVVAVVLPMILLAWQWNGLKHHRPRLARLLAIGLGVALTGWLI
jgi:uncharacterized membrane protein